MRVWNVCMYVPFWTSLSLCACMSGCFYVCMYVWCMCEHLLSVSLNSCFVVIVVVVVLVVVGVLFFPFFFVCVFGIKAIDYYTHVLLLAHSSSLSVSLSPSLPPYLFRTPSARSHALPPTPTPSRALLQTRARAHTHTHTHTLSRTLAYSVSLTVR